MKALWRHTKAVIDALLTKWGSRFFVLLRNAHERVENRAVSQKFHLHPSVGWGHGTWIYGDGHISIGERTYIGRDCYIASHPAEAKLTIGKGCAIAHNVHIRTATYARVPSFSEARGLPSDWGNVTIGNDVWIGTHVYIGPGITVGDNSIIGANSVVTKDVPPNTVVGGVPARILHTKAEYEARSVEIKNPTRVSDPVQS